MNKLKVAIVFSVIGQYSYQILSFATIVILARLLTPAEIGVYAVAGAVTLIATELRSFGAVQYLIREAELTEEKTRVVLGVTIVVSWFLGITLVAAAPFVADFYGQSPLQHILWLLSISFFVGPFTSVPIALWKRNMQFRPVMARLIVGVSANSIASIAFVLLGFSYYGLALGFTIGVFAELLVTIVMRPPGTVWVPRFSWIRDLVRFGFFASLTNLFIRFSEGIPDLVIGRFGTMADVGQFSRGLGAVLFIKRLLEQAVGPVVLPHLSEVKRSGKAVDKAYLDAINLLISVSWPVMAVASAAAYPMINLLFGDQWTFAISVTSILALWSILTYAQLFGNFALIAAGHEKAMFWASFASYLVRFGAVIYAAPAGIDQVAWAMVASGFLEAALYTYALHRAIDLKIVALLKTLAPNALIAGVCWLATYTIDQIISFESTQPLLSILIIAPCLTLTWLAMLFLTRHAAWRLIVDTAGNLKDRLFANSVSH